MIHYENMTKDRIISLLKDTLEYAEEKDKEIERLNKELTDIKKFKNSLLQQLEKRTLQRDKLKERLKRYEKK